MKTPDEKLTASLRRLNPKSIRARYHPGDLQGALCSGYRCALKAGKTVYVYQGNSYMVAVWRVTFKEQEANTWGGNINSTYFQIDPDGMASVCDRQRAMTVQTQTKAQVEAALEKRLRETCADKRATLALESTASPGVSRKQGSLF